jgi:D-alanyl-D-alanine carboxypeptidase/D-alanyl-D-alanine-endopeptidase (penicillin-binding protein 4)
MRLLDRGRVPLRVGHRSPLAFLAAAALLLSACSPGGPAPDLTPAGAKPPVRSLSQPSGAASAPAARVSASAPADGVSVAPTPAFVVREVRAPWTRAIDDIVGTGGRVSVAVGRRGTILYEHGGQIPRMPASNEKLLTSMAALDTFGPDHRFRTFAGSIDLPRDGVVRGDLWLVGTGDPELTSAGIARLAVRLRTSGVRRIRGSVIGDASTFTREWWAPGWIPDLSRHYVARPTALAVDGNVAIQSPERYAAWMLTEALERIGVSVGGEPDAGRVPAAFRSLAAVRSARLSAILARQNRDSINFPAEMLTKALGETATVGPGSTAAGAASIEAWVEDHGVRARVEDGSGLSHLDRIRAVGLVALLMMCEREPWGDVLFESLPGPGTGTLDGRLDGVPVRAKTGTLFVTPASALSGYVEPASGRRLSFSILSRGLAKSTAVVIEDAIVRVLASARF